MKFTRKRVAAATAALAIMLILAAPLVHFEARRVGAAIGRALGRQVTVSRASLRLFPWPGVELEDVVIGEDPAFGAEPMMTAPSVVATVRLNSLWRRRLEFGSISFQDRGGVSPSFNLVRRSDGEWNIERLLSRAASTPAAPTGTRAHEPRPHFPYIEVTSGRLNFKSGLEKKVVALTEADFALWLDSDDEWRARLKAKPMRTDANLSDTGVFEADGMIHRGAATTVEATARLRNSQLGQLSALIYGRDRGWRGATEAELRITGDVSNPTLAAHAVVNDFRRYDINADQSLRLEASCTAQLLRKQESVSGLQCRVPYGDGHIVASGAADLTTRTFDLGLQLDRVPVQRVVGFARRAKRDLPRDLIAEGTIDGHLHAVRHERAAAVEWEGRGELRQLVLKSGETELRFPPVAIAIGTSAAKPTSGFIMVAQPFNLELGGERPVTVAAQVDTAGYSVSLAGPVLIPALLRTAHVAGMAAPTYEVHGSANVQLLVAGTWAGFSQPLITGAAQITNATAQVAGLGAPLKIASAQLELTRETAALHKLTASVGPPGLALSGWIAVPRGCAHPEQCTAQFNLAANELDLSAFARSLAGRREALPWYRRLSATAAVPSLLLRARANGQLEVGRLQVHSVAATRLTAGVMLDRGQLRLSDLRAQVLGGTHEGEWSADFTGPSPRYSGHGRFTKVPMAQVAAALHEPCCTGTAAATYTATLAGRSAPELLSSAAVQGDFIWQSGLLTGFEPRKSGAPLRFSYFRGHARFSGGTLALVESRIIGPSGIYQVSGTVGLDRTVALTMASNTRPYTVRGTLAAPKLTWETQRAAVPAVRATPAPVPTPVATKAGPGA